jgi:hypothetical protein
MSSKACLPPPPCGLPPGFRRLGVRWLLATTVSLTVFALAPSRNLAGFALRGRRLNPSLLVPYQYLSLPRPPVCLLDGVNGPKHPDLVAVHPRPPAQWRRIYPPPPVPPRASRCPLSLFTLLLSVTHFRAHTHSPLLPHDTSRSGFLHTIY